MITDITKFSFAQSHKLLLDANVWITIYGPPRKGKTARQKTTAYSNAYKRMRTAGSSIFTSVIILSEFTNRLAHFDFYAQNKGQFRDFKAFRKSPRFKRVAASVAALALRILNVSRVIDVADSSLNMTSILREYGLGDSDFNDLVIEEACAITQVALITDDADFRSSKGRILTANRKLLSL